MTFEEIEVIQKNLKELVTYVTEDAEFDAIVFTLGVFHGLKARIQEDIRTIEDELKRVYNVKDEKEA